MVGGEVLLRMTEERTNDERVMAMEFVMASVEATQKMIDEKEKAIKECREVGTCYAGIELKQLKEVKYWQSQFRIRLCRIKKRFYELLKDDPLKFT